ncbi:MAG: protein kinase, partial [Deltaproteobacteria bacterium]|nr:protein kinase [Deltaproteobacteria bacterium]
MKLCESCGACLEDVEGTCGYDGGELRTLCSGSRVIGGRYLLEQRVSAGAMGIVLRATHLQVGSTVAVKLMRPGPERHVALARFQREAQILGRIKHPNAVLVMDFGVDTRASEAVPYLVMEYLRGESMLAHLERHAPLTLAQAERILTPLCDAVEEAHAVGVIHRDLKPSNVVLERLRDGSEIVKVLDFGIGKFIASGAPPRAIPAPVSLADGTPVVGDDKRPGRRGSAADAEGAEPGLNDDADGLDELDELDELAELLAEDEPAEEADDAALAEAPTLPGRAARAVLEPTPPHDPTTSAGLMIGTVPYMAAEQMTGERITRAADVHAVAVMIFQCLSGRLPYEGDDDEIIAAKLGDERPSLRELGIDVAEALDELLRRAFARDPAERPGSVRELAVALRQAAGAEPEGDSATAAEPAALARVLVTSLESVDAALRASHGARVGEDHYARARDRLLAASEPLQRLHDALTVAPPVQRGNAAAALDELEGAVAAVRRALARLGSQPAGGGEELVDYLRALWTRLDLVAQECLDARGR